METLAHPIEDAGNEPDDGSFEGGQSDDAVDTPFEYTLLKGHIQPDGQTWKSDQELRMEYLHLTDELIHKMTTKTEIENPETGEMELQAPSVVVFLDKSARPLSHLVRELWPTLAKDPETGEIPPMPRFNFLNIDREKWVNMIDPHGIGIMDIDHLDPSIVRSLRSIFLTPKGKKEVVANGSTEAVDDIPTILDNESVLVVDETYSTGRTLKIASDMLERAFPEAHISTTHWMRESFTNKNGLRLNAVPVWYKENSLWGRGVGDRYADFTRGVESQKPSDENYYRTIGRWFLSMPHWYSALPGGKTRDEDYYQLVREIKELARNPDTPIMPHYQRDDMDERIVAYNRRDVDISTLSEDEKEAIITDVIKQKNAIHEASKNSPRRR